MVTIAVPTASAAITAEEARSVRRSCDRTMPSVWSVSPSVPPRSDTRDHLAGGHGGRAEGEEAEGDEHDHQGAQRFVDRVQLLAAHRLQFVAEGTDRGGEVPAGVDAGRQVDVAHRVHGEVAVGLVEGAGEDDEAEDRGLIADRLAGHRADADERQGGRRRRGRGRREEVERQPIPDLEIGARGHRLVDEHLVERRRVGQAAGADHGTFERKGVVGGGE